MGDFGGGRPPIGLVDEATRRGLLALEARLSVLEARVDVPATTQLCRVTCSTQSVVPFVWANLAFDVVNYDPYGWHDVGPDERVTVPRDGHYRATIQVDGLSAFAVGDRVAFNVTVDGAGASWLAVDRYAGSSSPNANASAILSLAEGKGVGVRVWHSSAAARSMRARLSVEYVGPS